MATYDDKIIPVEASAAALAGRPRAKAIVAGHDPGMADAAFTGSAQAWNLGIVANNTKHVLPFGADAAPPDEAVHIA